MPAEWEPHEATWLAWPCNAEAWPGKSLERIQNFYLQIMEVLLEGEKVHLLIRDAAMEEEVRKALKRQHISDQEVHFHYVPAADIWIRDYGPVFIRSAAGKKLWCKWEFNAWGRKYEDYLCDNDIFSKKNALISYPCVETGVILEGGSVDVNGAGLCLTTEQCLLHPNREAGRTKQKAESYLRQYLGIEQVFWLKQGLEGDDTDGHIDNLARFAGQKVIVAAYQEDPSDRNYSFLHENWRQLKNYAARSEFNPLTLVPLPMPGEVRIQGSLRPASYANFYICNQAVLVPVFEHPNDARAAAILKELFPKRRIVPISCSALIDGFGAIHCMTQQEPL